LINQDMPAFVANIKISDNDLKGTIEYIDKVRQQFRDPYPFRYEFMYDRLAAYYSSENRMSKLMLTFTIIAILIAAMGLLGLSSFLTQVRTKEIGIRKVFGAVSKNIMFMLIREFSLWIIVADLIALPISVILINKWMQSYPYRIEVSAWVFILSVLLSMAIAILTISLHSYRSANRNPVEALRYE